MIDERNLVGTVAVDEIEAYIRRKICILKHLKVSITDDVKRRLSELKTEIAIDNYARGLILRSLEEWENGK